MKIRCRFRIRSLLIMVAVSAVAIGSLVDYWWEPFPKKPYSDQLLALELSKGHTVVVSVFAHYDLNSVWINVVALETPSISRLMRDHGLVILRADLTEPDPVVTQFLKSHRLAFNGALLVYSPADPNLPIIMGPGVTEVTLADTIDSSIKAAQVGIGSAVVSNVQKQMLIRGMG